METMGSIILHFILSLSSIIAAAFLVYIAVKAFIKLNNRRRDLARMRRRQAEDRERKMEQGYQTFELYEGKPACSPMPFEKGKLIRIDIRGLITFPAPDSYARPERKETFLDAYVFGATDSPPGSWTTHQSLFFDDDPTPAVPFSRERHHHAYSYAYTGTGAPLTIFLSIPQELTDYTDATGSLTVTTVPITQAEYQDMRQQSPSPESAKPQDFQAKEDLADESSTLKETEPQRQLEFAGRLHILRHEYANTAYADDNFVKQYAKRHGTDLLSRKADIVANHLKFHDDQAFIAYLNEQASDVYSRATWEMRALGEAERLDVEEPPGAPQPESRRPTPDEYRERELKRKEVAFQDFLSNLEFNATAIQRLHEKQKELGINDEQFDQLLRRFEIMQRQISEPKDKRHGQDDAEVY